VHILNDRRKGARAYRALLIALGMLAQLSGCADEHERPASGGASQEVRRDAPMDRVDIPPVVRKNLGITFVDVQLRHVAQTVRVPGHFELAPLARREFRTVAKGRVELHVEQHAGIVSGQLLFTLDSPDWRELQQRLNEAELRLEKARVSGDAMLPVIEAHEQRRAELDQVVTIWAKRVTQLEASRNTGAVTDEDLAQARVRLAAAKADLAGVVEEAAQFQARKAQVGAELASHRARLELLLDHAGVLLGRPFKQLHSADHERSDTRAGWRNIHVIEVRAESAGVVESLSVTNGAWVEPGRLVLTIVQPDHLRFRAMGLQADLPRIADKRTAQIAPPLMWGGDISDAVHADLHIGLAARPKSRTIELIARPHELRPWMRPGVSAFLEIVTDASEGRALAIPRSAIVKDGIAHVFFRRDPDQPIRVVADMGADDERWVVIRSGLMRGDEVVSNGAYELKLATDQGGVTQAGGHFHADGSFHEEH